MSNNHHRIGNKMKSGKRMRDKITYKEKLREVRLGILKVWDEFYDSLDDDEKLLTSEYIKDGNIETVNDAIDNFINVINKIIRSKQ